MFHLFAFVCCVCCEVVELQATMLDIEFSNISAPVRFLEVPAQTNPMNSEEIASILAPLLEDHLERLRYGRVHLADCFLTFYKEQRKRRPMLTPLKAMEEFDGNLDVASCGGGICYALNDELLKSLPEGLFAYKVAATVPQRYSQKGFPKLCHEAVVVPFETSGERGVILLEPNFCFSSPIVLHEGGEGVLLETKSGEGMWWFRLVGEKIHCYAAASNQIDPIMWYDLRECVNAAEVGLKAILSADEKLPLVCRDRNGVMRGYLTINLKRNVVQATVGCRCLPPIPFGELMEGGGIDEETAAVLRCERTALNALIKRVIEGRAVLGALRGQYFKSLESSPRKDEFIQ